MSYTYFLTWCTVVCGVLSLLYGVMPTLAQSLPSSSAAERQVPPAASTTITFDRYETGPVPAMFTSFLRGYGTEVSWDIRQTPAALSGRKVLAQTSYEQVDYRFPLLVYNPVVAQDVRVTVAFQPVSGTIDQAAGLIVRFQDPDNYYAVRANPLENTVQLYRVVNGVRQVIAGVSIHVETGQWHTLEVLAQGDHFTVWFDDHWLFDARDDTYAHAGKIGLSTKSDGVTMFDDLQVTVLDHHSFS